MPLGTVIVMYSCMVRALIIEYCCHDAHSQSITPLEAVTVMYSCIVRSLNHRILLSRCTFAVNYASGRSDCHIFLHYKGPDHRTLL